MGKWSDSRSQVKLEAVNAEEFLLRLSLPPPPPLLPRPGMLPAEPRTDDEPLDYSLKGPLSHQLLSLHLQPEESASTSSRGGSPSSGSSGDEVLHKLRHAVLKRRPGTAELPQLQRISQTLLQLQLQQQLPRRPQQTQQEQQPSPTQSEDSDTDSKAAYAAECIKTKLEGCGKRVHLFLGVLLHFGMPPGRSGQKIFDRVIAFSDEHKQLQDRPTAYFMVLDSKLLALVWCKFKGNSSNEYSTLTRAIRSTRQKYKGIFEAVENPGKKLYKFGPLALDQFRNLFPGSYSTSTSASRETA